MLEQICAAFTRNPRLGVAGGVLYERSGGGLPPKRAFASDGYVQGPVKFYRRECFDQIGGLIRRAGWDGVDIVKARMSGWETAEIESLRILHLKPMGTAKGEGMAKASGKVRECELVHGRLRLVFPFEGGREVFAGPFPPWSGGTW